MAEYKVIWADAAIADVRQFSGQLQEVDQVLEVAELAVDLEGIVLVSEDLEAAPEV